MVDISMCRNEKCPLKDKCYRFLAKPDPRWQSYLSPPIDGEKCEHFINIKEYKEGE